MGGALDSARFRCYLSKALNVNPNEIEAMVIGGHGDTTMIPLARYASYKGRPVSELLSKEALDKVVAGHARGPRRVGAGAGEEVDGAPVGRVD